MRLSRDHAMHCMMVLCVAAVECSAKIAMATLSKPRAASRLLRAQEAARRKSSEQKVAAIS
jgi:hypothetical protein